MSSSSWRNVLASLCTISERMQGCCDELLMLHRSKWRCLASTYSAEIQDLIEQVEYEQQMSRWNNLTAGPLQALEKAVQEGHASMKAYIPSNSEGNYHSWLVDQALKLGMSTDVVDVHLHDFLWASFIVREQVFSITGRKLKDHLLEQARKLHEIWLKEDAAADLRTAESFLIQLKGDNDQTCQLVDFILSKLSHIEGAAHNHVTPDSNLPPYMCIDTDQCRQANTEGIFRNDHTEVREVMWLGGRFVLKSFKYIDDECDHLFDDEADVFNREAAIQARVWHPHVVPLVCCTSKPPGLLMELLQEDLTHFNNRSKTNSKNEPPFPLVVAVDLMLQIAKGMEYLHTLNIIHRDLKSANILVSSPDVSSSNHASTSVIPHVHLKIADFGVSKAKLDCSVYTTRNQGTNFWMAPEVYEGSEFGHKYSNKADVYSFGIVCYEIWTGNLPFERQRSTMTFRERVLQGERPPLPEHCPPALASFIQMCWHADPTKRPTFIQICRMLRFFKACILLADCDDEAQLLRPLLPPYICAPIDDMIDHSLAGRTFQPKALGIPLEMYFYGIQAEQRRQKLLTEEQRQQENLGPLLKCVTQDVGFSRGRPVAACIIYKCLLQWRSFEAESTNVFDQIIQTIGTAIESQGNDDILAYWLTNTSMLLFLLHRILKPSGTAGLSQQRRKVSSATVYGRMTQAFRSSPASRVNNLPQIEAKYPALQFKQQLTAYVEKIYRMIRDNLTKEITPVLKLCIQAPRTSSAKGSMHASSIAQQSNHWHILIKSLSNLLSTMRANHVSAFLVEKFFTQIFSFINVELFNSFLRGRECCSFSHGDYVLQAGLRKLEHWVYKAFEEYAGSAWDELKHTRQAVEFLVMHQKPKKSLAELRHDFCPVLSIQQIYRMSTMYWDAKYETKSVSPEVIANMRDLMKEDLNNDVSSSFLLDHDSFLLDHDTSIPFSVDDIWKSMPETDLSDVDPPPMLRENPGFFFLQPLAA